MLAFSKLQLLVIAVEIRKVEIFCKITLDWTVETQGTALAQRLRCCATNRKVAGSIPDGVIGIFH